MEIFNFNKTFNSGSDRLKFYLTWLKTNLSSGTSDEHMTVMECVPNCSVILTTSPQVKISYSTIFNFYIPDLLVPVLVTKPLFQVF